MSAPVTIPPTQHANGELHEELDRLDRELETMRARLAREQGALHEARARCHALSEPPPTCEPTPEAETSSTAGRRLSRRSRLESTLVGSRGRVLAMRPIPGVDPDDDHAPDAA
jgi:hypothetical protein